MGAGGGARGDATRTAWPDRAIGALAAGQRTIVTQAQLVALGIAPRTIRGAVARGRLHRVHAGVYSLVPDAVRPRWAAEQAALLACGPRAFLSHRSAAELHGLRIVAEPGVELTVAAARARRRPGLIVHRTASIGRREVVRVGGLRTTSIARTVLDLAPSRSDRALEYLIDEALKRTGRGRLEAAVERHRGRRGVERVRALLDPQRASTITWSVAEELLLKLFRRAGLPAPEANVAVGGYVPDFTWREWRVIAEFDSYTHHSGVSAFGRDLARGNDLGATGWEVVNVTWRDLAQRPERVVMWVTAALLAGGWRPG